MATFHGKQGKVTFAAGVVANVLSWLIECTADVVESSVMDYSAVATGTHWKEYLAGFLDWTAIIECDMDDGGLVTPGLADDFFDEDGVAVILYCSVDAANCRKYTGNGIVTGISPSVDLNDIEKVTYTVQGSGALVEAIN